MVIRLFGKLCAVVDAFWVRVIGDDPEPKNDCCPECGGVDRFDGYGVCQHCEPM